jgi:predicted GNAT family acetyltransferase
MNPPPGGANASEDSFECTARFLRRGLETIADTVRPIDGGWLVLTPSLPVVWSLNHLRLVAPMDYREALERAEQHLAKLAFRHLVADSDALGRSLDGPLRGQGFSVEREVVMAWTGPMQKQARGLPVIEADERAMTAIERRWYAEDARITAAAVDQMLEAAKREQRVWHERHFAIAGDNKELAAITKLRSDGTTAQVEDVYTVPEARGRGFASALVSHALTVARQSGNDLVFIVADDCNWPKHLYARLGFAPVGRRWVFHKDVR